MTLTDLSIADLKALLEFAKEKASELPAYVGDIDAWIDLRQACRQELLLRARQPMPQPQTQKR